MKIACYYNTFSKKYEVREYVFGPIAAAMGLRLVWVMA